MYRIPDMKTFRESQHVVYQHGMLSLNSGFHAWRTTNKSLEIAANWMARYMVTKDFFAEQTAMKKTCEYRYPGECTARNNGFLGWHMKGSAKYKYRLGSIGRWFYAMRHALPIAFWVYVLLLIFLLHVSLSGKPGDTFRTLSNILVSKRIIAIVLFVLTIYVALTQFPRQQMDAKRMCSRNYTHVLPGGKIMVDRDFICDPNFKCAKGGMWFYFWTAVSKIENRTVVFFIVCSVIEQTRVLWVYGVFVIIAMVYRRLVNVRSGTAKEGASLDEERG